jgi:hypothetical protein
MAIGLQGGFGILTAEDASRATSAPDRAYNAAPADTDRSAPARSRAISGRTARSGSSTSQAPLRGLRIELFCAPWIRPAQAEAGRFGRRLSLDCSHPMSSFVSRLLQLPQGSLAFVQCSVLICSNLAWQYDAAPAGGPDPVAQDGRRLPRLRRDANAVESARAAIA